MTQTAAFIEERTSPELEDLRRQHGVRLVDWKEDGTGVHKLPAGVYGYTYSPGLPQTPLFGKSGAHMFEVHKAADGGILLIGYVTREAASQSDLALYPGKRGAATQAIAVPMRRVIHLKQSTYRETGALELRIGPH